MCGKTQRRALYRLALARSYRGRAYLAMPPPASERPASSAAGPPSDLDRSRELLEKLVTYAPQNRTYRAELAITCHNLGTFYAHHRPPELAAAESWFRKAVDLRRILVDDSPSVADASLRMLMAESLQGLAVVMQQTKHKEEVPQLYAKSRELLEDALRIEPKWDEATLSLGLTLLNWGVFLSYDPPSRRKAESLFTEAIGHLAPIVAREPEWDRARMALCKCHGGLAQLYAVEGRHAPAARQWEHHVAIAGRDDKEYAQFFLAMALARAGEHRKAWSFVQQLRPSLVKRPAEFHTHLAVVSSLCLGAAENDPALAALDRARVCSDYAVAGVELLRQAFALVPGPERPAMRSAQLLDPDMKPLRRRPDFQALLAETAPAPKPSHGGASAPAGNK